MKFKIEEFIRKHQKSVLFAGNGKNFAEYTTRRKGHNGTPCIDHLGNMPLEKCLAPMKL